MESGFCRLALETLFPRFCLSCGHEGQIFCLSCMQNWIWRPGPASCPFCGEQGSDRTCETCRQNTFLDGLVCYAPYGNPIVRQAIGQWKYDGDRSVEFVLKRWLMQSAHRLKPSMETFVVSPVSSHVTRKRSRGFDQAEIVSIWVSELFLSPMHELLVRTQKTKPQAKQKHVSRSIGSLDGIFQIHPNVIDLPTHVLLSDDVFTSGATMDAAAKCLKEAGVEEIWGFVIAKG